MDEDRRPERRRASRSRLIAGAHFVVRSQVQACVLVNLSRLGACLHLLSCEEAPEAVLLHLPGGLAHVARLRWQEGARAGYAFLEPLADGHDLVGRPS